MLGAAVRDIHAKPVLMRQMIEDAIASEPFLTESNLADAVEQIKFTPVTALAGRTLKTLVRVLPGALTPCPLPTRARSS